MLARRLRRRPNIDPTLVQFIVFAGLLSTDPEGLVSILYDLAARHITHHASVTCQTGLNPSDLTTKHS